LKDNNWFYKDLSTGFEFFVPFDQFYVYRMGGFNLSRGYILEIHSFFLSRKEQDGAQCVLQKTKL